MRPLFACIAEGAACGEALMYSKGNMLAILHNHISRYWYDYFGLNPEDAAGEVNRMVPDEGTSGKEEEEIL